MISPASGKYGWNTPQILQILDETTIRWNIDPHRIYLTGYSMGGFGKAGQLKDVPTWMFHGDADNVVP